MNDSEIVPGRSMTRRRAADRANETKKFKREANKDGRALCSVCDWKPPGGEWRMLHAHHVVPVRHGGSDEFSNLILLCPNCHALVHLSGVYPRKPPKWFRDLYVPSDAPSPAYDGPTNADELISALRRLREVSR